MDNALTPWEQDDRQKEQTSANIQGNQCCTDDGLIPNSLLLSTRLSQVLKTHSSHCLSTKALHKPAHHNPAPASSWDRQSTPVCWAKARQPFITNHHHHYHHPSHSNKSCQMALGRFPDTQQPREVGLRGVKGLNFFSIRG